MSSGAIYYKDISMIYRYDRILEDGKRENCQDDYYKADVRRLSKEKVWRSCMRLYREVLIIKRNRGRGLQNSSA